MKYAMDMALPEQFPLDKLKQVFEGLGYRWVQHIPEGEVQMREEIWELPSHRGIVRYIFDQHVNVPSIRAESDIRNEPGKILLEIYPHLPLLDTGDLVRLAQSTQSAERRYGLRALASVTTDFEWRVVEEFSKVLKDPDPKMRMLAMVCIARYPYKLFAKELE